MGCSLQLIRADKIPRSPLERCVGSYIHTTTNAVAVASEIAGERRFALERLEDALEAKEKVPPRFQLLISGAVQTNVDNVGHGQIQARGTQVLRSPDRPAGVGRGTQVLPTVHGREHGV